MSIPAATVKELRDRTGAGMMDCKQALQDSDGDIEAAIETLRKRGIAKAAKKAGRQTSEGRVDTYVHPGWKVGVMVEVNCETDFVAKTDEFKNLVKDLAMHIAATKPLGIGREDISEEILRREEEIYRGQAKEMGKPEKILDKIVEGKMEKFYKESCLLEQQYVKDTDLSIQELIHEMVGKTGESISVRRFVRYQLGGE